MGEHVKLFECLKVARESSEESPEEVLWTALKTEGWDCIQVEGIEAQQNSLGDQVQTHYYYPAAQNVVQSLTPGIHYFHSFQALQEYIWR